MLTRTFVKQVLERAIKTAAQVAVVLLVGPTVMPVDVLHADWLTVGSYSAGAALVSVLTSIASWAAPVGADDSPSLVDTDH